MQRALLFITLVFSVQGFTRELSVPVIIGEHGTEIVDACPSFGGTVGLKSKKTSFLAVRSGPNTSYTIVDKLYKGQTFYICSTSKDTQWHSIIYSDRSTEECDVSQPVDKPRVYTGKCKSGWVHRKWVKIIAG